MKVKCNNCRAVSEIEEPDFAEEVCTQCLFKGTLEPTPVYTPIRSSRRYDSVILSEIFGNSTVSF